LKTFPRVLCVASLAAGLYCARGSALEAGAAKVEIAPGTGVPLDGDFARRGRPATGMHDPLYVRALFLQDEDTALFVVVADLFAVSPDLRARVIERAPAAAPHENIVLAATHTLNGPGGLDRSWLGRQRGGRYMQEQVDAIAAKFAEAMQLAYDGRKRASAGYAAAETSLAVSRFDPPAPVDGQLSVLRVDDSDGNPVAILANFGVGPQGGAGGASFAYSAGLPGAFCGALEAMTNSAAVAFFLNGASGDQIAAPGDGTQTVANSLAARVKALVNEIKCREATLGFHSVTQDFPVHSASPFYPREAVFQVIEIDRLAMLFLSPIPGGATGTALRKAVSARGYAQCMVVAPANGYVGAVAPVETIALRSEGSEPVYLGPGAAKWLLDSATQPLSRGQSAPRDEKGSDRPAHEDKNGVAYVAQSGTAFEMGEQRGRALRELGAESLAAALPPRWLSSAAGGGVLGHWELLRPAVSLEALTLPIAGEAARALLRGVGQDTIEILGGMSEAAGASFASLWLRQLAPSSDDAAHAGPVGVAFGVETADDGILLGQTIEWSTPETVTVVRVNPKSGHAYVAAGLPWQVAGVAGVNDRGIAVAIGPSRAGVKAAIAVPAEVLLAEVLAHANSFDEAMIILGAPHPGVSGRVFVAFDDGRTSRSATVEVGEASVASFDAVPALLASDDASPTVREVRVRQLIEGGGTSSMAGAERILADRDRRAAQKDHVLGPATRACIVLVPRRHELRVMAPEAGAPRAFEAVKVREGES
jgi:hypothetical protein